MTEDDIPAVEAWYGEAAAAAMGLPSRPVGRGPGLDRGRPFDPAQGRAGALSYADRDAPGIPGLHYQLEAAQADPDAGLLAIALTQTLSPEGRGQGEGGPAPIGLLDYRAGRPAPGWLTIGFIALARPHRGLGLGSEAVRLLEGDALHRGLADRFRANVDLRNGLGLYFWLRLGYRPARPDERFWPSAPGGDIIWMIRTEDNPRPENPELRT